MIIGDYIGGLGNNMLQIAACIGLAKRHDTSWGMSSYRRYFPDIPVIRKSKAKVFDQPEKTAFLYIDIPHYDEGTRIRGYWFNLRYFEHAKKDVLRVLQTKKNKEFKGYTSIHIRRGDYLNTKWIDVIGIPYYLEAIKIMKSEKYMVFSDDITWCMENLPKFLKSNLEYSKTRDAYEDICNMSSCDNNIIANSTYSWWGAMLNENKNKKVVCPSVSGKNWINREDCKYLYPPNDGVLPDEWIKVNWIK